jgi:hypothetical protein
VIVHLAGSHTEKVPAVFMTLVEDAPVVVVAPAAAVAVVDCPDVVASQKDALYVTAPLPV